MHPYWVPTVDTKIPESEKTLILFPLGHHGLNNVPICLCMTFLGKQSHVPVAEGSSHCGLAQNHGPLHLSLPPSPF